MYTRIIETKQPGRFPYQAPAAAAFTMHISGLLCASDLDGVTEEWEEVDLSNL